jgi:hypothetical protein
VYGFGVQEIVLDPKSAPRRQLRRSLTDFVFDNDSEGRLLIVYYTGHGNSCASGLQLVECAFR